MVGGRDPQVPSGLRCRRDLREAIRQYRAWERHQDLSESRTEVTITTPRRTLSRLGGADGTVGHSLLVALLPEVAEVVFGAPKVEPTIRSEADPQKGDRTLSRRGEKKYQIDGDGSGHPLRPTTVGRQYLRFFSHCGGTRRAGGAEPGSTREDHSECGNQAFGACSFLCHAYGPIVQRFSRSSFRIMPFSSNGSGLLQYWKSCPLMPSGLEPHRSPIPICSTPVPVRILATGVCWALMMASGLPVPGVVGS